MSSLGGMDAGLIGAIAGSALGVAGGLVGTYVAVKNTRGPRERRFMLKVGVAVWGMLVLLALALVFMPSLRFWVWLPLTLLVLLGIPFVNRRQQAIRRDEEKFAPLRTIFH